MKYVVDVFTDTVKEKSDEQAARLDTSYWRNQPPLYRHVFDTREAANAFIIKRAEAACDVADLALKAALRRLRKCERKFQ